MSGKGSGRRPAKVDGAHVAENWARIFGSKKTRCDQCKAEVIGKGAGDEVVDYCPECEQIVEGNTHRS